MSQQHLDRLSTIDSGFLAQEGPNTHMHIGGIVLLEDGGVGGHYYEQFLAHIRSRLHLVPRYRQKLAIPPIETGRPVWVDDPTFNLEYHVRHTALPEPGDREALWRLASRIFSMRLDRSKPLWEIWLVEGLESGETAIISKTHHALVDGVSGVDLATVLFDMSPETREVRPEEPWVPSPEPTGAQLAAKGIEGLVRRAAGLAGDAIGAVTRPGELVGRAAEIGEGLSEVLSAFMTPPPATPFNVPPGPHRRFAVVDAELAEMREIKDAFGGTVNDVVLTVVGGGLAHFMRERGMDTTGMELRACVPVSIRTDATKESMGNEITIMMAPLPVDEGDPVARLRRISTEMQDLKDSKQAMGAQAIASLQDFAPPTIFAQASRLNFSGRMYNLLVTNVPGPQFPLYVLGHRMKRVYPMPFLAGDRALAIAIMSYDGSMNFGLLGDFDAMPDLDVVAEGIEGSLQEMLSLARRAKRTESRKSKRRAPAKRKPAPKRKAPSSAAR
jgi:WS/DGAT/MGAT family acyltransferase